MPLIYVNQVGGQDELVVDGASVIFDDQGHLLASAVQFQAQEHIPMPLEQAVLEHQPLGIVETADGPRARVVLVAARRDMIDRLQDEAPRSKGVIINPGAWVHTSHALADCLRSLTVPVVEVHLSNLFARAARDPFRGVNVTAGAARGYICGLGARGYLLAMEYLSDLDE